MKGVLGKMKQLNLGLKILLENCKTFKERDMIMCLENNQETRVTDAMVTNLYKSALNKAFVDFEDIPNSKGDITKFSGYENLIECLEIVDKISKEQNVKINELNTLREAINNIVIFRNEFTKGYLMGRDFVIIQYNTLCAACVESMSAIISSYVDYIKTPNRLEFQIIRNAKSIQGVCIDALAGFNASVKSGEFKKVMSSMTDGRENFVGVMAATILVGAAISIVPIMRELCFHFYYTRMKLSQFLEQQAALLEINKIAVKSSSLSSAEKKEIVRKQEIVAKKMLLIADKMKVNNITTNNKVKVEIEKENKGWSISEVEQQAATQNDGFIL